MASVAKALRMAGRLRQNPPTALVERDARRIFGDGEDDERLGAQCHDGRSASRRTVRKTLKAVLIDPARDCRSAIKRRIWT
jgi:hypothetical protein